MMGRKPSGMVLLTTMMMIAMLVMLTLSLMQGVLLYIKASHQLMARHRLFYRMEAALKQLDITDNACIVKNKTPNQLVDLVIAHQGCILTDDSHDYVYLVDDLGLYPCLQTMSQGVINGSHHWLVTLTGIESSKQAIQVRIAKYAETGPCDGTETRRIEPGVVSWRKI